MAGSGLSAIVQPSASIARPWLSSDAGPASHVAVGASEVAEPAGRVIEGRVQEAHARQALAATASQPSVTPVEQVDLQRARDVIDAVAVGRIGLGSDGVLHDPELAGQGVEVRAGSPDGAAPGQALIGGQRPAGRRRHVRRRRCATSVRSTRRYSAPTAGHIIRRL